MAEETQPKWEGKATVKPGGITPDEVWPLLEDFCSLNKWLPGIDTCYQVEGSKDSRACPGRARVFDPRCWIAKLSFVLTEYEIGPLVNQATAGRSGEEEEVKGGGEGWDLQGEYGIWLRETKAADQIGGGRDRL
ncbi:uncharacterized protein LOC132281426 [Cornus florida]|uniref:uncharacterized protein LOC132281426 n=1 Tax=Cornus florida TaxID=4283 RepID=UPI00289F5D98|nr:uncharacterized protein LOC132281426 [Cornus florida]